MEENNEENDYINEENHYENEENDYENEENVENSNLPEEILFDDDEGED